MNPELFGSISPSIVLSRSVEHSREIKSERKPSFILPGSASSPPQILTLDEVRFAVQKIKDMRLAHTIAINPDFCLQSIYPAETHLEKRIKSYVHNWDNFRKQLNRSTPIYDHAIVLLEEIKQRGIRSISFRIKFQNFSFIVPENADKALKCINDSLNEKIIRKEADSGTIDLQAYTNFIIRWMAKLSTPCREYEVNKLMDIEDTVVKFRRILEVMNQMKLDVADFLLEDVRREVTTYSVEYEKRQLDEFLEKHPDGFLATNIWLRRNLCVGPNEHLTKTNTLIKAYLDFLDWNPEYNYPETMSLDREVMKELSLQALRLCGIVSIMAIIDRIPIISQNSANRLEVINEIALLFEDISSQKQLEQSIENIWHKIRSVILHKHKECGKNIAADMESAIRDRVLSLAHKDSTIRSVMWSQLIAYVRLAKTIRTLPPVPPNYFEVSDELQSLADTFKRLTIYNYSVFGDYYEHILNELIKSEILTESHQATVEKENKQDQAMLNRNEQIDNQEQKCSNDNNNSDNSE